MSEKGDIKIIQAGIRELPLRIVTGDDMFVSINGKTVAVSRHIVGRDAITPLESLRFAPFVFTREELNGPNAKESLSAKVRDAKEHAEELVAFANKELSKIPGNKEQADVKQLLRALDSIENHTPQFIDGLRSKWASSPVPITPRENTKLLESQIRRLTKEVPDDVLEAISRERIPFVVQTGAYKEIKTLKKEDKIDPESVAGQSVAHYFDPKMGTAIIDDGSNLTKPDMLGTDIMHIAYQAVKNTPQIAVVKKSANGGIFSFVSGATKEEVDDAVSKSIILQHLVEMGVKEAKPALRTEYTYKHFLHQLRELNEEQGRAGSHWMKNAGGFYTLPDKPEIVKGVLAPEEVELHSGLFLTPACIEQGKKGDFHYLTTADRNQIAKAAPDSAYSLAHLLVSFDKESLRDKSSFMQTVQKAYNRLKGNGVVYYTEEGKPIALDAYFDAIQKNADAWLAQAQKQQKEIIEKPDHQEMVRLFKEKYAQLDEPARTLIQRGGIKFILDPRLDQYDIIGDIRHKSITFNPVALKNDKVMPGLRDQALLQTCEESGYQDFADIWKTAKMEMDVKESKIPADWLAQDAFLTIPRLRQEERARQIIPVMALADHVYEYVIKEQAYAIKHGAPLKRDTSKQFVADGKTLTTPQREYFEALNEIIKTLDVTPEQLDIQFRNGVKQLYPISYFALHKSRNSAEVKQFQTSIDGNPEEVPPVIIRNSPANPPPKGKAHMAEAVCALGYEYMLGYGKLKQPMKPLPHEMPFENRYTEAGQSALARVPADKNMIQAYAQGELPFALLKNLDVHEVTNGNRSFAMPRADQFFTAAMHNSIIYLAEKQGIIGEEKVKLDASLQKLESLNSKLFLWPNELAQTERLQQTALAARQGSPSNVITIQRVKEEPTHYAIHTQQGAYARILKGSEKTDRKHWLGIKNEEARLEDRQLSVRMHYLHKEEIEPLHKLINVKLPGHEELASILFADTTLQRAEYACKQPNADKLRAHPESFQARAQAAITQFFTQDMEKVPQEEQWRYDQIKDYLMKSPTLLIAALGNDPDLRKLRETHKDLLGTMPNETADWRAREAALAAKKTEERSAG